MGCYAVPAVAAVIHFFMRKKVHSWGDSKYQLWLNQLLLGGAIFGVVDHAWNGELFFVGENILMDLLLGVTITLAIFFVWAMIVLKDKISIKSTQKSYE